MPLTLQISSTVDGCATRERRNPSCDVSAAPSICEPVASVKRVSGEDAADLGRHLARGLHQELPGGHAQRHVVRDAGRQVQDVLALGPLQDRVDDGSHVLEHRRLDDGRLEHLGLDQLAPELRLLPDQRLRLGRLVRRQPALAHEQDVELIFGDVADRVHGVAVLEQHRLDGLAVADAKQAGQTLRGHAAEDLHNGFVRYIACFCHRESGCPRGCRSALHLNGPLRGKSTRRPFDGPRRRRCARR
jgi:hypothetical protein